MNLFTSASMSRVMMIAGIFGALAVVILLLASPSFLQ